MIKFPQITVALLLLAVSSSCSPGVDTHTFESTQLNLLKQAEQVKDLGLIQKANYSLARLYFQEGEYDKAIGYYLHFLEMKRKQPNDTYHGLAWNLAELANLYFHAGQYSAAIPIYQEAIQKLYDYERNADTIRPLDELAVCNWKNNDTTVAQLKFKEAQENYNKSVSLPAIKQQKDVLDVQYALMLEHWADMSKMLNRADQSAKLSKTAADIWSQLRQSAKLPASADKPEIVEALARQYCRSSKPVEAEALLSEMFEMPNSDRSALAAKIRRLEKECKAVPGEQSNQYISKFNALKLRQDRFDSRQMLCQKYAWAVPNKQALDVLFSHQPLIEIGAGAGYWASLVRQSRGQIVASDVQPVPKANSWHELADSPWTNIVFGDETLVRRYPESTLFLCWPPEINRCAYNALRLYRGNTVIYIGEDAGGCTGTREFHDLLARDWHLSKQVEIPQWPGVYDMLYVYRRNKPLEKTDRSLSADAVAQALGPQLAKIAQKSPAVAGDLADLVNSGIKVQFANGRKRAFFDRRSRTISISNEKSDSQKLQSLAHEYSHVFLNPTLNPIPGKTGRSEFIQQGLEQEADAVIHELIVAYELKAAGVPVDKETLTLLSDYTTKGRPAILKYILTAKNSATNENYIEHFNSWYDEIVPPTSARP